MILSRTLLALVAATSLAVPVMAAPANPAPKTSTRTCFRANDVENFSAPDDRTVYVRVNRKDVFRLDLFSPCPDVDWAWEIALESRGSSWICSALDATVITKTPIGPQKCQVKKLTKLSAEELAALPKRSRP
ncbi:MAG: DUF6491 family protein [Alphaproteobacteria bacterium]|jgi:hypothetical protein